MMSDKGDTASLRLRPRRRRALSSMTVSSAWLVVLSLVAHQSRAGLLAKGLPPWPIPSQGNATLTHYDLPRDAIVSCGCVADSTHYPTAAINELAYGSATSFGPACGACFRLTLSSTPLSPQPPKGDGREFAPGDAAAPNVVVKITDLCPLGGASNGDWCAATTDPDRGNKLGSMVHFDLAWPSKAIPQDFYPLNSQGGDYGVWWTSYEQVACEQWAGWDDAKAWGSDWAQQDSACCVPDPGGASRGDDTTATAASPLPLNAADITREAQVALCPSYSRLAAANNARTLEGALSSAVPNTSNILTKRSNVLTDEGAAQSRIGACALVAAAAATLAITIMPLLAPDVASL